MNDSGDRLRAGRRTLCGAACALVLLGCGPASGQTTQDVIALPTPRVQAASSPSAGAADLRSPDGGVLHSVAAADGRIVGVGATAGGAAAWSVGSDGAWTQHRLAAAADVPQLDAVALAGPSVVAFGGDGQRPSRMWVADGGTTWQAVDADVVGIDGRVNAVTAVSGDRWIAVGDRVDPEGGESYQGAIWISEDGRSFTPVTSDLALAEGTLSDVATTGDTVVVVGFDINGGKVWSADDMSAFSAATGPFEAATVEGVAATNDGFVAVGRGIADLRPLAWTSEDGRRWQRADVEAGDVRPEDQIRDVSTVDGVVIAVGGSLDSSVLWTLEDGLRWRRRS